MSVEQARGLPLEVRREKIKRGFENIRDSAGKIALDNREVEKVCLTNSKTLALQDLPQSIESLIKVIEEDIKSLIILSVSRNYENFRSTYSYTLRWNRENQSEGAVIDALRFNLNEDSSDRINEFFPTDSKTPFKSDFCFPYFLDMRPDSVPEKDRPAMEQYRRMDAMIKNPEFEVQLLEDIISVFDK